MVRSTRLFYRREIDPRRNPLTAKNNFCNDLNDTAGEGRPKRKNQFRLIWARNSALTLPISSINLLESGRNSPGPKNPISETGSLVTLPSSGEFANHRFRWRFHRHDVRYPVSSASALRHDVGVVMLREKFTVLQASGAAQDAPAPGVRAAIVGGCGRANPIAPACTGARLHRPFRDLEVPALAADLTTPLRNRWFVDSPVEGKGLEL